MENKTGKYFKYAIGEIILVMVGILLALQVNNWNENRKIKNTEQAILTDLRTELKASVSDLKKIIDSHNTNLEATIQLTAFVYEGEKARSSLSSTPRELFREMDFNSTFDPKLGILKSIINSGKIDYISNKELRYTLSSLIDLINDTNESTNEITRNRPLLLWTTQNKYNERQADGSINYNGQKLRDDPAFIWWLGWLKFIRQEGLEEENQLLIILEEMIKTIDSEIKK